MSTGTTERISAADAAALIRKARCAADLFGADKAAAIKLNRLLMVATHPDASDAGSRDRQAELFKRLRELWRQYQDGNPDRIARGDIADLFAAPGGPAMSGSVLKLCRDPRDNDLMAREVTALRKILADADPLAYFPQPVSASRQKDPATGIIRRATTLVRLEGFVSLAEVRQAYPEGIDPRDAAWMWRRLLVALGAAHRAGVIHGAVLPEHVMIHPADHGLVLIDWCYSATGSQRVPAIVERYRDWYPEEIEEKKTPGPATDIFMAAMCMRMAGDPGAIPRPFLAFANGCMLPAFSRRPDDAWALLERFDGLLERLWGPRKFHEFTMPETEGE